MPLRVFGWMLCVSTDLDENRVNVYLMRRPRKFAPATNLSNRISGWERTSQQSVRFLLLVFHVLADGFTLILHAAMQSTYYILTTGESGTTGIITLTPPHQPAVLHRCSPGSVGSSGSGALWALI